MKNIFLFPTIFLIGITINAQKMEYPKTEKENTFETYFGTKVEEPYRWLENDASEKTTNWVKEQNETTHKYLDKISFRSKLKDQLTKLWNYEKFSSPVEEGDYLYFFKNDGLQAQSILYRQPKSGGEAEIFLNPNKFSEDGTTSLAGLNFCKGGKYLAYQISEGGSDWRKIIVLNTETNQQVGDPLIDVKFSSVAWVGDEGFYYSSYDKPKDQSQLSGKTEFHKLYFHKLNTPQSEDKLIFGGEKTPRRYIMAETSEDNRFLIITAANSTNGNELYLQDLNSPDSKIIPIVEDFENNYSFVASKGSMLYFQTDLYAPNNRLVKFDFANPKPENWSDVVENSNYVLNAVSANGYFFLNMIVNAHTEIVQLDFEGNLIREIKLPGIGQAEGFNGKERQKEVYYSFTSYVYPTTIFKFNTETGISEVYKKPKIDFNPDDFYSEQVFYTSKDGTRIPMTITYLKSTKMNGKNPTILYGYGGFNISLLPSFSVANAVWLKNGGIYAVANLRGGGEYGKKWHNEGIKLKKKNVFNDFIAAAEFLISNKFTSSQNLALSGGSNGGLLVGATMTMRPDLAKVALPAVGVLDMLRYHKFTAGAGWAYDYGTADDSKEMFEYLKSYSPIHNVKKGVCYPATLITTGDHDDRVVPSHSYKFAAELQENQSCNNPTLIRIETRAGHGAGKPTEYLIEEAADKMAFALYNFGIKTLK